MLINWNKGKSLCVIDSSMIKNGVLTVPEGIEYIDYNLDELLADSGIRDIVSVVILPETLKKVGNFLYQNQSVKLVVFNSEVELCSPNHQGSFEASNIEVIIARYGFKELNSEVFRGDIIRYNCGVSCNLDVEVCPAFYNCRKLEKMIIGSDKDAIVEALDRESISIFEGAKSWSEVVRDMRQNPHQRIRLMPVIEFFQLPYEIEKDIETAKAKYTITPQRVMVPPVPTGIFVSSN